MKIRDVLIGLLVLLGFVQLAGAVFHLKPLRLAGLASVASPLPTGLSDTSPSTVGRIRVALTDASFRSFMLTPGVLTNLTGPYERRNVYYEAVFYARSLPEPLVRSVLEKGLCLTGPLAQAFKFGEIKSWALEIWDRKKSQEDFFELKSDCKK